MKKTLLLSLSFVITLISSVSVNAQWVNSPTGFPSSNIQLSKADDNTFFTLTNSHVLKSTDAGKTWQKILPNSSRPSGEQYYAVNFLNNTTGYVSLGNSVLKTTDGGITWVEKTYDRSLNTFDEIKFATNSVGYTNYKGNGPLAKTTDGGETWNGLPITSMGSFFDFQYTDKNTGYYVGLYTLPNNKYRGVICKTMDGGQTATYLRQDGVDTAYNSVYFVNDQTGWVTGSDLHGGIILKTTDGGQTWSNQLDTVGPITHLSCINENVCYGQALNWIVKTVDGGKSWVKDYKAISQAVVGSALFVDSKVGLATWGTTFLRTDIIIPSDKVINTFNFSGLGNATISGNAISITVPANTNITNLTASFTFQGVKVTVGGKEQISGVTAHDFTNPVNYNVTASDNSVRTYTVMVNKVVGIEDISNENVNVLVFPHPITNTSRIVVKDVNQRNVDMIITNIIGQEVKRAKYTTNSVFELTKDDMKAGIYLYQLIADGTIIKNGKLIVE